MFPTNSRNSSLDLFGGSRTEPTHCWWGVQLCPTYISRVCQKKTCPMARIWQLAHSKMPRICKDGDDEGSTTGPILPYWRKNQLWKAYDWSKKTMAFRIVCRRSQENIESLWDSPDRFTWFYGSNSPSLHLKMVLHWRNCEPWWPRWAPATPSLSQFNHQPVGLVC